MALGCLRWATLAYWAFLTCRCPHPWPPWCSKATRKQCGGTGPGPEGPTQQCIADYNAAMEGPCGKSGSLDTCCAALKGLGSCLDSIAADMSKQGDKYTDALKWM